LRNRGFTKQHHCRGNLLIQRSASINALRQHMHSLLLALGTGHAMPPVGRESTSALNEPSCCRVDDIDDDLPTDEVSDPDTSSFLVVMRVVLVIICRIVVNGRGCNGATYRCSLFSIAADQCYLLVIPLSSFSSGRAKSRHLLPQSVEKNNCKNIQKTRSCRQIFTIGRSFSRTRPG
jgi:hypothetical protein